MWGYLLHEHLGPVTVFSVAAFSQVQLRADCLPQEHLAWEAQTQPSPERPQQVLGTAMMSFELGSLSVFGDEWKRVRSLIVFG